MNWRIWVVIAALLLTAFFVGRDVGRQEDYRWDEGGFLIVPPRWPNP